MNRVPDKAIVLILVASMALASGCGKRDPEIQAFWSFSRTGNIDFVIHEDKNSESQVVLKMTVKNLTKNEKKFRITAEGKKRRNDFNQELKPNEERELSVSIPKTSFIGKDDFAFEVETDVETFKLVATFKGITEFFFENNQISDQHIMISETGKEFELETNLSYFCTVYTGGYRKGETPAKPRLAIVDLEGNAEVTGINDILTPEGSLPDSFKLNGEAKLKFKLKKPGINAQKVRFSLRAVDQDVMLYGEPAEIGFYANAKNFALASSNGVVTEYNEFWYGIGRPTDLDWVENGNFCLARADGLQEGDKSFIIDKRTGKLINDRLTIFDLGEGRHLVSLGKQGWKILEGDKIGDGDHLGRLEPDFIERDGRDLVVVSGLDFHILDSGSLKVTSSGKLKTDLKPKVVDGQQVPFGFNSIHAKDGVLYCLAGDYRGFRIQRFSLNDGSMAWSTPEIKPSEDAFYTLEYGMIDNGTLYATGLRGGDPLSIDTETGQFRHAKIETGVVGWHNGSWYLSDMQITCIENGSMFAVDKYGNSTPFRLEGFKESFLYVKKPGIAGFNMENGSCILYDIKSAKTVFEMDAATIDGYSDGKSFIFKLANGKSFHVLDFDSMKLSPAMPLTDPGGKFMIQGDCVAYKSQSVKDWETIKKSLLYRIQDGKLIQSHPGPILPMGETRWQFADKSKPMLFDTSDNSLKAAAGLGANDADPYEYSSPKCINAGILYKGRFIFYEHSYSLKARDVFTGKNTVVMRDCNNIKDYLDEIEITCQIKEYGESVFLIGSGFYRLEKGKLDKMLETVFPPS